MLDRLLAAFTLLLFIGLLAWNSMYMSMKARTLQRENNSLELHIARIERAMPWIAVLNESLTDLEKAELDAKVGRFKPKK